MVAAEAAAAAAAAEQIAGTEVEEDCNSANVDFAATVAVADADIEVAVGTGYVDSG